MNAVVWLLHKMKIPLRQLVCFALSTGRLRFTESLPLFLIGKKLSLCALPIKLVRFVEPNLFNH